MYKVLLMLVFINRFSKEKIALCQIKKYIEVLKKMGRPIVEVKEMKNE